MKISSVILSLFLVGILVFNIAVLSNSDQNNILSLLNLKMQSAWANEVGSSESERDCLTASKLKVTSIKGCVNVSVSVGDLLDSSAGLEACVEFEWKDCYKIDCYDGRDNCTPYDWMVCSSNGCPSFCD